MRFGRNCPTYSLLIISARQLKFFSEKVCFFTKKSPILKDLPRPAPPRRAGEDKMRAFVPAVKPQKRRVRKRAFDSCSSYGVTVGTNDVPVVPSVDPLPATTPHTCPLERRFCILNVYVDGSALLICFLVYAAQSTFTELVRKSYFVKPEMLVEGGVYDTFA